MSELQGGKFGHGFASAAVTQLMSPVISQVNDTDTDFNAGRVAVAALVGGTTSAITGGKFANGALTAAFSRAYNDESHHDKMLAKADDVVRRIDSEVASNNERVLDISGADLALVMYYDLNELKGNVQYLSGDYSELGPIEFAFAARDYGDSQFLRWNESVFRIADGPMRGVHRGTDINYYYQGFLHHAAGNQNSTSHGMVAVWNLNDFLDKGFDPKEIQQISRANRWSDFGFHYREAWKKRNE